MKEEPKQETNLKKHLDSCEEYQGPRRSAIVDKQETIEEVAKNYAEEYKGEEQDPWFDFMEGAKWQQQQENIANDILNYILTNDDGVGIALGYNSREMIEQHFKNIGYDR